MSRTVLAALAVATCLACPASAAAAPEVDIDEAADIEIVGYGSQPPFLLPAGDVNGDGRQDVTIAADLADEGGRTRSWVVFGTSVPGVVDLRNLGDRGLEVEVGDVAQTALPPLVGWDINGDGRQDALAFSPGPDARFVARYQTADGRFDDAAQGFVVEGAAFDGIADLNGDGVPEILLTIPRGEDGGDYLLLEGDPSRTGTLDVDGLRAKGRLLLSAPTWRRDLFLFPAGDVNGDGTGDAALNYDSVEDPSYTSVIFSTPEVDLSTLDIAAPGGNGYRVSATKGSAQNIGDLNGDGRADLLVPLFPTWTVVYGAGATAGVDALAPGTRGFRFGGIRQEDSLSGVGDFNGDGRDDLAATGTRDGGLLLFGRSEGLAYPAYRADGEGFSSLNGPGLLLRQPGGRSRSATGLGDVNGDGVDDLGWVSTAADGFNDSRVQILFGADTGPELAARLSPTTFRIGSQPFWVRRGSTLTTTLSETADVRLEVRDLFNRVVASQTYTDVPEGSVSRPFDGTVGGRRLGFGLYTAVVRATDDGGTSSADRRITFFVAG